MPKVKNQWGMIFVSYNGVRYYPISANSKFYNDLTVSISPIYNQTCPKYVRVQDTKHWELWRKGRPYDS